VPNPTMSDSEGRVENMYYEDEDGSLCIVSLYVDNLVISGRNGNIITEVKKHLGERYFMVDLGVANHILGSEA